MKKVFFLFTLIILLILCLASCNTDKLEYTSNGDGTCYVSGLGANAGADIMIPEYSPKGDMVTGIGESAFEGCSNLISVTFAEGSLLTTIGHNAFKGCTGLTSIEIPDSVTTIGAAAFSGCSGLTSVEIPDGVTYISGFYKCTSLISVSFGENSQLTSIGDYAFNGCSGLTSIEIPDGVTSVGEKAFKGCTGLTSIEIPAGVTSVGRNAFLDCTSLESITFAENSQLTTIDQWAFAGCYSLTRIEIPTSVTLIHSYAFSECFSLERIEIPFIGIAPGETYNTHFGYIFGAQSCFYNYDYVPGSLKTVIITGGDTICESAFDNCESIESITIPASVKTIGASAFSGCTNLTSIIFDGTTAQWNELSKGECWNILVPATEVFCCDGTIQLN